mgnify:CR=1 FL=1|tara:strand:+ start:87 stop:479 length:393 start_codon:yes stop_codon:yes gene_type:complete
MNKKNQKNDIIQGRWWKIKNNIQENIDAKYDKIRDWVMDPKGYFLISVDKDNQLIRVAYCIFTKLGNDPVHDMIAEVKGKTAIEIVNTLINKKYISTLQHAADMGIELHKAELALKYNLKYIQDKDLDIL